MATSAVQAFDGLCDALAEQGWRLVTAVKPLASMTSKELFIHPVRYGDRVMDAQRVMVTLECELVARLVTAGRSDSRRAVSPFLERCHEITKLIRYAQRLQAGGGAGIEDVLFGDWRPLYPQGGELGAAIGIHTTMQLRFTQPKE